MRELTAIDALSVYEDALRGSPEGSGATGCLAVAVDDARAVEVVRRQLAAHPIAGEDADAEAAHLARDVTEHDVLVIELHAKHRVRQGFDDFALEFDFLFFGHWPARLQRGGAPIRAFDNLPLLGFLLLRGRCAKCKARVSARYPLTELAAGLFAALSLFAFGPTQIALAAFGLCATLLAASLIDFDTRYLPDMLTLPLLWAGLIVNLGDTDAARLITMARERRAPTCHQLGRQPR